MKAWLRQRIDWLRAQDMRLLAVLAALGVLVVVFIQIGRAVSGAQTRAFDEAILLALRTTPDDPIGSPGVTVAILQLTALGSGPVITVIVIITTLFFVLEGRWRYALLVAVCAIGTNAVMTLLKDFYERTRPTVVTQIDPPGGHSFPSGHSMISAAVYMTLAVLIARSLKPRRLRVYVVVIGAALPMMIGFTRVYLGVHYPTDVIAGWTAGALCALINGLLVFRLGKRGVEDIPRPVEDA